jgi:hypothetical protein
MIILQGKIKRNKFLKSLTFEKARTGYVVYRDVHFPERLNHSSNSLNLKGKEVKAGATTNWAAAENHE